VTGGFLRDADGRAVVLRGVNLAGAHKSKPYWGFHQPPDFARVRSAWGMNAIRLLIVWAAVEPQKGQYDDAYLDAVATRVQWAKDAGLFVVVDMHQDVYGEGFASGGGDGAPMWTCDAAEYASFTPQQPWFLNNLSAQVSACWNAFWASDELRAHYTEAWRRVAARLAPFGETVVGFDPMNEPYWGTLSITPFEPEHLAPFYEQIVPAVRSAAPWVAFTEPSSIRNLGGSTALPPFSFDRVVYSPHSYNRNAESGMGFNPADRDALVANLASLASEAKGLNAALWIGEYGGPTEDPNIGAYMTANYDGASAVAAGAMYWAYDKGGGYSILDASGNEKPVLMSVIVRPFPERTAGDPIAWTFDAASSTFMFTYHANASIKSPTVISIADRLYANGYSVDCGGCAFTKSAGSLSVTTPPSGDPARVTIHP
jgi:endoglycosylceramidase